MKNGLITIKNFIYTLLMVLSAIYLVLRVISIVLVKGFDFVIFSRTYEINLLIVAPSMDIIMSAICFTVAFIYFNGIKGVAISLIAFLLFMYSIFMWFPTMIFSQSLTSIESPSLTDKYAVSQYSFEGHQGERILHILVYKEHYPLLYKLVTEESETFSKKDDYKTIDSFEKKNYKINEEHNFLYYGEMKVPLK